LQAKTSSKNGLISDLRLAIAWAAYALNRLLLGAWGEGLGPAFSS
jgi:hypothetical protein